MTDEFAVRRNAGRMRFGYKPHPIKPDMMIPDDHLLSILDEAFSHLQHGYSLRDVSNWIFHRSGVRFDYSALRKAYLRNRKEKHGRKPRLTDGPLQTGFTTNEPSTV